MTETRLREGRIASLRILAEYTWLYLANLTASVNQHLGEPGQAVLDEGLRRFGYAEGQMMRDSATACADGRNAVSFIKSWRSCDLLLASAGTRYNAQGSLTSVKMTLSEVPGAGFEVEKSLLARYWRSTLDAMAAGFDETVTAMFDGAGVDGFGCVLHVSQDVGHGDRPVNLPDPDPVDAQSMVELSRDTLAAFSLLTMHTGQALLDRFGQEAEPALREGLYNFGVARAKGMREDILSLGKPLNFETWFEAIQRRDPNAAAFVFRGDSRVSPGIFQVRCTYCPMAEAWATEGATGLAFGQIYDLEVHRGLVGGFHPDGVVAWDKLKTRGDKVCDFRFSIPGLVTKDDPDWAQQAS